MGNVFAVARRCIILVPVCLVLGGIGPPPGPEPDARPLRVMLLSRETRPLPGMTAIRDAAGEVFPEGVRTRLLLQAADPRQVIEVDHIYVRVTKLPTPPGQKLAYSVDPLKQPGFGAAAPRKFNIILASEKNAIINYTDEHLASHMSEFPDLLPVDLPLLRLDPQSGVQETIDVNLKAVRAGFYQVEFQVAYVAGGNQYEETSSPVRIFRQ